MGPAELTVFRGTALTDDGPALRAVLVRDGMIVAVEPLGPSIRPSADRVVQLCDGEVLIPGLVDTHVHINEPGRTEWEGFATATRAAAAGGVTTLVDMPLNSIPPTTSVSALAAKRAAADGQLAVDVGFWGGAVPDNLDRLAELWQAGVFGFKCFLVDSGVPEFPPLDAAALRRAMSEIAELGGLLAVHAEDPRVIADHRFEHGVRYGDFLASRPPSAETAGIRTVLDAAAETGCRTHIVHLSSAEALPMVAAAKAAGLAVTAETCPHYLTLSAEDIADGQTQFKCCPPVRDARNQDLLWQALRDGVLDVVVSDHSPSPPQLKALDSGDFAAAWGGISSLQLGLSLVWTAARARGVGLGEVVRWMSSRPADLVGLSGRGRIAPGQVGDFAVFAPEESFTVDAATLRHRHPVSPYHGRRLTGVVRATYCRGSLIEPDQLRGTQLVRGK